MEVKCSSTKISIFTTSYAVELELIDDTAIRLTGHTLRDLKQIIKMCFILNSQVNGPYSYYINHVYTNKHAGSRFFDHTELNEVIKILMESRK